MKKRKSNKGFTLIELIVVIAILGILAMLIAPKLAGFTATAKLQTDESNAKLLTNVAHMIYAETDSYPADLATLNVSGKYLDSTIAIQSDDKVFSYDAGTGVVTVVNAPAGP